MRESLLVRTTSKSDVSDATQTRSWFVFPGGRRGRTSDTGGTSSTGVGAVVFVSDVFGPKVTLSDAQKHTKTLTGIFGGTNVGPLGGGFDGGGWETNTLVSDTTTVICLDDYHLNDRAGAPPCQG